MMQNPPDVHSGCMTLQIENDIHLQNLIMNNPSGSKYERYIFYFAGEKNNIQNTVEEKLVKFSADNYELMKGRIIPTFSGE